MLILRIILVKVKNLRSSECSIIPALLGGIYNTIRVYLVLFNNFLYSILSDIIVLNSFKTLFVSLSVKPN